MPCLLQPPKQQAKGGAKGAVTKKPDKGGSSGGKAKKKVCHSFICLTLTCLYLHFNLFPLIPACTAHPGLPLSPPETAFLESPYYRPQTASIADRHHPTNFHSVTYTQSDDAAFEAGSDNDHKSFLRMRVIFTVEYPAELFRFRRVLDDILSSFDVF